MVAFLCVIFKYCHAAHSCVASNSLNASNGQRDATVWVLIPVVALIVSQLVASRKNTLVRLAAKHVRPASLQLRVFWPPI